MAIKTVPIKTLLIRSTILSPQPGFKPHRTELIKIEQVFNWDLSTRFLRTFQTFTRFVHGTQHILRRMMSTVVRWWLWSRLVAQAGEHARSSLARCGVPRAGLMLSTHHRILHSLGIGVYRGNFGTGWECGTDISEK